MNKKELVEEYTKYMTELEEQERKGVVEIIHKPTIKEYYCNLDLNY